jgi:4-hydroxy-tetrahydrodipicolinate synthase
MFEGVFSALVTPFDGGQLDRSAMDRLLEYQIQGGVAGVVPCGTTGESATLDHAEHREVIRSCVERVAGRVKVIAGTGSNSTAETIQLTRYAKEVGADGALLITPYYNKPGQEGLFLHYKAVSEAVDLPLLLYNVPGRTAVDLQPQTVARLAEIETIVAIKEATADMERAAVIRQLCGDKMALISGDDATFLPFLVVGGQGIISVTANVAPSAVVGLWDAWKAGDLPGARGHHERLLALNRALFCETNPIPVKAAAAMMGLCGPEIRLPLTPLAASNRPLVLASLRGLGLLDVPSGHFA